VQALTDTFNYSQNVNFHRIARPTSICFAALAAVLIITGNPKTSRAASNTRFDLVVPMYQTNQAAGWAQSIAVDGTKFLVTTPFEAMSANPDTLQGISNAAAAGKTVLGYQTTGYAPKPGSLTLSALQARVTQILGAVPSLGGIFLDEVSSFDPVCAVSAPYFQSFGTWFRTSYPTKKLVLNSGSLLCQGFEGSADAYVIYENSYAAYDDGPFSFKPQYAQSAYDWLRNLPNEKVWMIVHTVPEDAMVTFLDELSDTAGVLWSTSNPLATAYASLPPAPYLATLSNRALLPAGLVVTTASSTLCGTEATDVIVGTAIDQAFCGKGGNDFLFGVGGNDVLSGGNGIDYLDGGDGADILNGDNGGDNLQGGDGNDTLNGNDGHDFLFGLNGDDVLHGDDPGTTQTGIDTLLGGNGNDTEYGYDGTDVLYGDAGDDTLFGGAATDWIFGGPGNDSLHGQGGFNLLWGDEGTDWYYPGPDYNYMFFSPTSGTDVVTNFHNGKDFFVINGSASLGITTISDLQITQGAGYAAIKYGTNLIFVFGATVADFDPTDFYFA
jgi:Spherulation-specific family 4/RTX calcium-binding nonapeptide repeat (4 copies)